MLGSSPLFQGGKSGGRFNILALCNAVPSAVRNPLIMHSSPPCCIAAAPTPAEPPTLRSLARSLGLSRTTVSDALRGNSRVNPETMCRVQAAARAAGYDRNPLRGAVMSLLRKSRRHLGCGELALVEMTKPGAAQARPGFNDALIRGIRDRARAFGFQAELFAVEPDPFQLADLEAVLRTRGIQGLLLLPSSELPDYSGLQWERYAAVSLDPFAAGLHVLSPDHHRSMAQLLRELAVRGYRRPGLLVETFPNPQSCPWEAAFLGQRCLVPGLEAVPPLRSPRPDRVRFVQWFRKCRPDVVLTPSADVRPWLEAHGAQIPQTHGLVCLDHQSAPAGWTALDLQATELGARATEIVITHLLHGDLGLPAHAALTTLPARLVEGDTLRLRPAPAPPATLRIEAARALPA